MSINGKPKITFAVKGDYSFSKILSNNRNAIKSKNLTDNKEISLNFKRDRKSNKYSSKFQNPILAKREAEYDKNLKRIKSNLLDKFDNYSLLNSTKYENSEKYKILSYSKKKKLRRERSRYNLKQYSPSVLNSKKFFHLEVEFADSITNNDGIFSNVKSKNIENNTQEKNNTKDINKNAIISMRIDEKENNDYEIVFDADNSDSKNKLKKRRFAKKILSDKNNLFSIEHEGVLKNNNSNIIKNLSCVKNNNSNNHNNLINSNAAIYGSSKENNLILQSKKKFSGKNIINGSLTQSNTTKNTSKKFIFNTRGHKSNNSGERTQAKFSELRNKIENNLNLNSFKKTEVFISLHKNLNFGNENNNHTSLHNTNSHINYKEELSFNDEVILNESSNKNDKINDKDDFVSKIQKNYKKFIKENFNSEENKIIEVKDLDMDLVDIENYNDISFSKTNNENEDYQIEDKQQEVNSYLNDNCDFTVRRNTRLEIIHEKYESLVSEPCRNSSNDNLKISLINNAYHNEKIQGSNNPEKSGVLESGSLSKKFSEMKRTISNNLNNINIIGSNQNHYSDIKLHTMLINNDSERLFASSLINSMESIKNLKQNLKIFSNNLNPNNENVNVINNNPELSSKKSGIDQNFINDINNNFYNSNNNYVRSLQNSSIYNLNNNNLNSNMNLFSNNLQTTTPINIVQNPKTPEIIHPNNNMIPNPNFNLYNNAYLTQNQFINPKIIQNNASFNPCSTLLNSNNFDLIFNSLNIHINANRNHNFNNQLNSIYQSNNQILSNLNQKSINESISPNNIYSLSGQFKNFNNQLTKINLNDFQQNSQNLTNNLIYLNDQSNNKNLNFAKTEQKINQIEVKNQALQDQINLVSLSFSSNFTPNFNSSQEKLMDSNNFFSKIKLNDFNNSLDKTPENLSIAEKLIYFSTDQYRNLLNVCLNIDYGKDILKDFHQNNFELPPILINHLITDRMRTKMVDWIIEVTENYRCDQTTYFLAINLMDTFFSRSYETLKPEDLHIIGICCMFIASKYYDIFPIKLASASEKISHGKISKEEIKAYEEKILKTLNYDVSKPTAYDFLNFYIEDIFNVFENNYNVKNEVLRDYIKQYTEVDIKRENKFDKNYYERFTKTKDFDNKFLFALKKVLLYLSKMNCYDICFSMIKPSLMAGSTLLLGVKITEQILQNNYINDYLLEKITELSLCSLSEIYFIAEKILHNCKNFENIYPNLENLKKFYFDFLKL